MSLKGISNKVQLKDPGEIIFDKEIIFFILNALTDDQGKLIITREEESIPFIRLWSLYKAEEERIMNESDERLNGREQSMPS